VYPKGDRYFAAMLRPLALSLALATFACSTNAAAPDGGADASIGFIDICDAFTGVGTACPLESPIRCFAACEASGCYCVGTADGPAWSCVTDLSCVPDCGPLDDGCGGGAAGDDGGDGGGG
jgi:hypothetical protein